MDGCGTADFFETAAKQRRSKQQKDDKPFHKMILLGLDLFQILFHHMKRKGTKNSLLLSTSGTVAFHRAALILASQDMFGIKIMINVDMCCK